MVERSDHEPVSVIGFGPIGLATALQFALTRDVALLAPASRALSVSEYLAGLLDRQLCPSSIETVPANLLALLTEFGIPPAAIGVNSLHRRRYNTWESADAACIECGPIAHVARPRLENALLRRVLKHERIRIEMPSREQLKMKVLSAAPNSLIDATGRRAFSAINRHIVSNAPASRIWTRQIELSEEEQQFRMAALPEGYAYRLGTSDSLLFGLCGNARLLTSQVGDIEQHLGVDDVRWFGVEALGFHPRYGWKQTKAGASGPQRAEPRLGVTLVGDAAFARDPLCSQGLSLGFSDVTYASNVHCEREGSLWHEHRLGQYLLHLQHLSETLARCRFHESAFWSKYKAAIDAESISVASEAPLRGARLVKGHLEAIA